MEGMTVIPVLDLMGGQVVHARRGRRDDYRPVCSALCPSSQPEAVLAALLGRAPFRTVYVADLDAIRGRGDHRRTLRRLRAVFPDVALWTDSGLSGRAAVERWLDSDLGDPVIGSECLGDLAAWRALHAAPWRNRLILSLDSLDDRPLGPDGLADMPALWPERVIVMTLARVGSGAGPDFVRLARIRTRAPDCRVFAAGGVRDNADLDHLVQAGAAGVLVASALHDGRIAVARYYAAKG